MGKTVQSMLRALSLILLPLAFGLRERRVLWVLYALSGVLFMLGFAFPFDSYFANIVITGT